MWETVSSKEIFTHPRLTLWEDEVILPNGHKTSYLKYGDDGGCFVTLVAIRDGKILVQKEYSYPPHQALLQFPGGGVHAGEDISEGANRELMEEMNLRAGNLRLLGSYLINNRRSAMKMHIFLATDLIEESLEGDIEEDIEELWHTEEEIDALIRDGAIIHNHVLAAWCLYKTCR